MKYLSIILIIIFGLFMFDRGVLADEQTILFSNPTPTSSVEYVLPFAGLLPDHPLYSIKVLRDRILLFFTRNPEKRVHINLLLSDKRLVMGQILWEKGNIDLSVTTLGKGEKYLLSAAVDLAALKKQANLPPGLSDKLELATNKHEEIIMKLMKSSDDQVKRQGLNLALGINHQAMQQILLSK